MASGCFFPSLTRRSAINTAPQSLSKEASNNSCFVDHCQLFQEDSQHYDHGNDEFKKNHPVIDDAEKAITEGLYGMSLKEREQVLNDVHGVSDEVQEDPQVVQARFMEMEVELRTLQHTSAAFQIACIRSPVYVTSLYLMFLRADRFDAREAAGRLTRHFDVKLELFGQDKLCQDITLQDFNKYDMECMECGFFQLLPTRDRAGRAIICNVLYEQQFNEPVNSLRVMWYLHMIALKDEETQRKGAVAVIYNVTPNANAFVALLDKDFFKRLGRVKEALPFRSACIHYCFSDPAFGFVIKCVTLALERNARTRTRLHRGSHVEVQYALSSFGIPSNALPINSDGVLQKKGHLKWLKLRKAQEDVVRGYCSNDSSGGRMVDQIVVPARKDVLFGRGSVLQSHVGNFRLSHLIEENLERYFSSQRNGKIPLVNSIMGTIRMEGGRFLRQTKAGWWEEVSDDVACDKIGHGFRNRKQIKPVLQSQVKAPAGKRMKPMDFEPEVKAKALAFLVENKPTKISSSVVMDSAKSAVTDSVVDTSPQGSEFHQVMATKRPKLDETRHEMMSEDLTMTRNNKGNPPALMGLDHDVVSKKSFKTCNDVICIFDADDGIASPGFEVHAIPVHFDASVLEEDDLSLIFD